MTDQEQAAQQAAKEQATAALKAVDWDALAVDDVDPRIGEYCRGVAAAPERHNVWEQLAVVKFAGMVERYGIDRAEVRKFFTVYESLWFPGRAGLCRYKLTPVQAFQFANIYGFWHNGRRVVREAVLFVPRKFSKTTSTAAVAVYDLLYGDANAESYTGANSADQAKKCFDVIRGCVRKLDPKGRRYRVNEQKIVSLRPDRTAIAQCLTANARTKDGLSASTVIMDEFSQARDRALLSVLTTSMGVRLNPLTVIITTASDVFEGPFHSMLKGYKKMLLEGGQDDVFAHLFEPDLGDAEDAEATWRKVHPHLGVTVSVDFYRKEYEAARRGGAEAMMAFRTKLLNVYAENEQRAWISSTQARSASRHIDFAAFGRRLDGMVAIDLSESDDFSAVTLGMYDPQRREMYFHTAYFFPRGALAGHVNENIYRTWAAEGFLTLTEGAVIDYKVIADYVIGLNDKARILAIGYDPWKSQELVNMLAAAGAGGVLRSVKQTYGNFTAPVESFEHGLKTGKVFINDNPINWFCFGNAVLDFDTLENCKPVKRRHSQKIDGVITMLMAMRLFIDYRR